LKSETEEMESKDKDKDKLKDNDLKSIFNVVVNNYSDISNPDSNKKKINKEHSFRKISFQNYFSKVKKKYIVNNNSQDKGIKLNKDSSKELLTIINSSKIQNSLPHFLFSRDKDKFKYHKKKKGIKVDMYNSKKYRSIKPQRDFYFKNKSSIFSSDDNDKLKTKLIKKKNYRSMDKIVETDNSNSKKKENNEKRKGLETKNTKVTCFLDRKKIDDLPIIYPLFLSYNNSYNTFSEKNRVEKILNKFICLKTQVVKDYKNRDRIMREFMIKNGVYDEKYFTEQKMSCFNEYLKKPFKFDPKKTIIDIIKEAVNYKYDTIAGDQNTFKPVNMFINHNVTYSNRRLKKNKNNSFDNINAEKFYKNPICLKVEGLKFDDKNLPILVNELESNLIKIQNEGTEKLNMLRGGIKKLKKYKIKDNNKFVPNLCLINQAFREQYEHIIDKENKKLMENYNKSQHIQEINDRMYYNNIKKRISNQNFTDEIRRKLKLTEYIVVQRAKKKMFLSQFNIIGKNEKIDFYL
jgi:hypothetical protein